MSKTLHYVFDPLCGWCYGASAAVSALADHPAIALRLLPSGLFSDAGARPMDDAFADYAWSNDQRIERMTGQRFSALYRSQVLADRQQRFDSGPATLALTAVALTEPQREPQALQALQRARYVEGQDITRLDALTALWASLGLGAAAALLAQPDAALLQATSARVDQAQALLQAFG
ncbi:MAG: DsbA family protein, partial [Comamonadaceae bacterium]